MRIIIISILLMFAFSAYAEEFKPRMASLKNSKTNVRAGPGTQYPILWVFKHKSWPVKIIAQYKYWYKIEDNEGEIGWIYKNLISNTHTVIISDGNPALMYRTSKMENVIMLLAPNVVLRLDKCSPYLCEAGYKKRKGWVKKSRLIMVK